MFLKEKLLLPLFSFFNYAKIYVIINLTLTVVMQTKTLLFVVGAVLVLGGGYLYMTNSGDGTPPTAPMEMIMPVPGSNVSEMVVHNMPPARTEAGSVKEFTMTAYYDAKGKWFSLKEMSVKKGDTVRVTITNTKGKHDFTIDEYCVKKELPLNEKVVVEFVADKAGDFVYYCSMPGHRAGGQWGTLRVSE